jgi:hypothetical protein
MKFQFSTAIAITLFLFACLDPTSAPSDPLIPSLPYPDAGFVSFDAGSTLADVFTPEVCVPFDCAMAGIACGSSPNGCGGLVDCGLCSNGGNCDNGECGPSPCRPKTCSNNQCGLIADGCSGTVDCGECRGGGECSTTNQCCTPETDANFCKSLKRNCGVASDNDRCGFPKTVQSCGVCLATQICTTAGACCLPPTDIALCATAKATCGSITVADDCGEEKTVVSCGICMAPKVCDPTFKCK